MPSYFEFSCDNPECPEDYFEMYARAVDCGDGSFDLIAVSDGPGLSGGSEKCPECDQPGELM